jgi:hypothetical protein
LDLTRKTFNRMTVKQALPAPHSVEIFYRKSEDLHFPLLLVIYGGEGGSGGALRGQGFGALGTAGS